LETRSFGIQKTPNQPVDRKDFPICRSTGKISLFADGALNLLGFMPMGFLLCLRLRCSGRMSAKNRLILSATAEFTLSLAIEWIQVWLPGRDSSALDVIWNTAGTALGAFSGIHFDKIDKIGYWLQSMANLLHYSTTL
jgi:glycopeptide antibiotics resistance protein